MKVAAVYDIHGNLFALEATFAVRYILDPPTEAESLKMFAGAQLS
jgi:hypothetical protein